MDVSYASKPIHSTASFAFTCVGLLLAAAGRQRLAGALLFAAGVGYGAVILERETNDDLRRLREVRWRELNRGQWAAHAALAGVGYRLLSRG